jgi:hypothetical protein
VTSCSREISGKAIRERMTVGFMIIGSYKLPNKEISKSMDASPVLQVTTLKHATREEVT